MTATPAEFWEDRYAGADRVWSGKPECRAGGHASLLRPGSALDLGCGEGADAIWLGEQGWETLGVDISPTAVARGQAEAARRGLARVRFEAHDLATWNPPIAFDLVTASFLQSPVDLPRAEVLRRAAGWVIPRGHLLIVTHAAMPPWVQARAAAGGDHGHADHEFLTAQQEVDQLGLDSLSLDRPHRRGAPPRGDGAGRRARRTPRRRGAAATRIEPYLLFFDRYLSIVET